MMVATDDKDFLFVSPLGCSFCATIGCLKDLTAVLAVLEFQEQLMLSPTIAIVAHYDGSMYDDVRLLHRLIANYDSICRWSPR